jgi:hypothetical protein
MERIGGILTVSVTEDTREIMISHAVSEPNSEKTHEIVIMPRYARHLAHVLLEQADIAEAESMPNGKAQARRSHSRIRRSE